MNTRGIGLVCAILVLAALASGYAWWHQWHRGRQALAFWGAETALLIRTAPRVDCLRLVAAGSDNLDQPPSDGNGPEPRVGACLTLFPGQAWQVAARETATDWAGLPHLRQALIHDPSYAMWGNSAQVPEPSPQWPLAFQFSDQGRSIIIACDPEHGYVVQVDEKRIARFNDYMTNGLRSFLADHPPGNP